MSDPTEEMFARLGEARVDHAVFDEIHAGARIAASRARRKRVILGAAASVLLVAATGAVAAATPWSDRGRQTSAATSSPRPGATDNTTKVASDTDCTEPPVQAPTIVVLEAVTSIRFCPVPSDPVAAVVPSVALTSDFADVLAALVAVGGPSDSSSSDTCVSSGAYRIQVAYTFREPLVLKFPVGCNDPYSALMTAIARQEAQKSTPVSGPGPTCPTSPMPRGSGLLSSVPEGAPFTLPALTTLPALAGVVCRYEDTDGDPDNWNVQTRPVNGSAAETLRIALLGSRTDAGPGVVDGPAPSLGLILLLRLANGEVVTVRINEETQPTSTIGGVAFGPVSREFVDLLR